MRIVPFASLLALLPLAGLAAGTPLQPGQWEIKTRMVSEGEQVMPETTGTLCMKAADVADISIVANIQKEDLKNCQLKNLKTVGSKTSWDMECSGPDGGRQHAEFDMQGTRYQGVITISEYESESADLTLHYSGRRLGACP